MTSGVADHPIDAYAANAHPAPHRDRTSVWALWFGLFGGHVAWSIQMLVNSALVSHSCYPEREPLTTPSLGGTWGITIGVSVLALVIGGAALLTAVRSWRATQHELEGTQHGLLETGEGRTRFMAFAGILLSGLFTMAIILNAVALFTTHPCGQP
jgi:MFS family permease